MRSMELDPRIRDLIVDRMSAAYVIEEESHQIVYANAQLLRDSSFVTGQPCYQVLTGRREPCSFCPKLEQDVPYLWEYFDTRHQKTCQIYNLLVSLDGILYRVGRVVDLQDAMKLSQAAMEYLALMKNISELQVEILSRKQTVFESALPLLAKQFSAKTAVFFQEKKPEDVLYLYQEGRNTVERQTMPHAAARLQDWLGEENNLQCAALDEMQQALLCELTGQHVQGGISLHRMTAGNHNFLLLFCGVQSERSLDDQATVLRVLQLYLENYVLQEQVKWESVHDKMTGLYNRREYFVRADGCYAHAESLGMIFLDIDNLKQANDQRGHGYGDRMIEKVGRAIKALTGARWNGFRMGGDEFAVVCCGCNREEIAQLRAALYEELHRLNEQEPDSFVEMSAGIAYLERGGSPAELYRQADASMYEEKRAKKVGRTM